jgi:RecB family exonuclease
LPDEPAVVAAEPERGRIHRGLRLQRLSRERAILEGRIDAFSGDLTAPDLRAPLAGRLAFDVSHPLSASSVERLAGCGFRALADVVLRLREPEEQDESLDPRHKGTLLHACLERAFTDLKAAGLLPLQGSARDEEERRVFRAAIWKEFSHREAAGEVGHPVVWAGSRRSMERVLLRVLEAEQRSKTGFVPEAFEVKFGSDPDSDRPGQALSVEGAEIQLGGRADRIDRGPGGSLRVVDYKTGSIDHRNKRLQREFAGRDLQLGHYALILRLAQPEVPVDASFYSIYQAEESKSLAEVCESEGVEIADFLDASREGRASAVESGQPNLANLIEVHLRRARGGEFAVQPGDCGYCKFAAGCRVGGLIEEWE